MLRQWGNAHVWNAEFFLTEENGEVLWRDLRTCANRINGCANPGS